MEARWEESSNPDGSFWHRPRIPSPGMGGGRSEALDMNGVRILLIIGNPSTRKLLEDLFMAAGASVLARSNGEQEPGQDPLFRPDLVIMDFELAGRYGQPAPRVDSTANTPTILLTTLGEECHDALGMEFGGEECLVKPFIADVLLARAHEMTGPGARFATIIGPHRGGGSQLPRRPHPALGTKSTRFASSGATLRPVSGFPGGRPPSIALC